MKTTTLLFASLWLCNIALADSPRADKLFEKYDYARAAELYKKEALKHPSAEVNYKLGLCYQKMNRYNDALASYEKVKSAGSYPKAEFYLNYGLMLKSANQCEAAKAAFRTYDSLAPADSRGKVMMNSCAIIAADHYSDLPITISNVRALNTKYSDYNAVKYKDGVVFTSTRRSPTLLDQQIDGWTGSYYTDLYYAKKGQKNTDFGHASRLEENMIDKHFHDGAATFSPNYDTIYISRVSYDLKGELKDNPGIDRVKIYSAKMGEYKWNGMTPVSFNSDRYSVTDPAFSKDGQKLFFSSDMPGSFGASDIFYCTREGKGWSQPIHLGPEVNTAGREVFPSLDSAGNLFFSSDGFGGFGGLDICVALNKNGSYSQASPMKMPFNSATDDFGLSFVKNERSGYFSSNRSGGEGDDDIYYFDLDQDSIKIPASIYTIGYKIPEAMARIHVSIFENPGQAPIQNGLFAYVDPLTKATDTLHFKNGTVDFSVPGKSEVVMDIVPTGFTPLKDSLQIGHVRKDTLINLVYNFANNTLSNAGPAVTNVDPRNMTMSFELKNIFFDFNKYDIRTSDQQAIDSVAEYLKSHPRSRVEIDAYADSRGTAEYNFNLSNERAQSAIKYLASKGIARNRMKPVGYGYTHLFNNCVKGVDCTEAEHQQNRRVVFHFFDSKTK